MQVTVPAGASVTGGRSVFPGTADSEIWMIRGDDPLVARADPYARRIFRDAHPLDAQAGPVRQRQRPAHPRRPAGRQGRRRRQHRAPPAGPHLRHHQRRPHRRPELLLRQVPHRGHGPADLRRRRRPGGQRAPQGRRPRPRVRGRQHNVENLYDFRDDPTDGCDFTGNPGCTGVNPPFDYVPASDQVYADRLAGLAIQIADGPALARHRDGAGGRGPGHLLGDRQRPHLWRGRGPATAGPTRSRSWRWRSPPTAGRSTTWPPTATAPTTVASVTAFMYRTDRVGLPDANGDDAVLGGRPGRRVPGAPAGLQHRRPEPEGAQRRPAGRRRHVHRGRRLERLHPRAAGRPLPRVPRRGRRGSAVELWVVSNHFSSAARRAHRPAHRAGRLRRRHRRCDRHRRSPAPASCSAATSTSSPGPTIPSRPPDGPSDQLAPLYDQGLLSLWDVLVDEVPAAAYSYVFEGQAQTLDQQFVVPNLMDDLVEQRVAHVNADWPAEHQPATGRGVSDHDPSVARFEFPTPPVPELDDEDFVIQQFHDFVGRPPTANELEVYTEALEDESLTRARLVDNLRRIAYDPLRAPVIRLYMAALGRRADFGGVEYWADRFQDGLSLRQMARLFVASLEFRTEYGELRRHRVRPARLRERARPAGQPGRPRLLGRASRDRAHPGRDDGVLLRERREQGPDPAHGRRQRDLLRPAGPHPDAVRARTPPPPASAPSPAASRSSPRSSRRRSTPTGWARRRRPSPPDRRLGPPPGRLTPRATTRPPRLVERWSPVPRPDRPSPPARPGGELPGQNVAGPRPGRHRYAVVPHLRWVGR